jgi:hypothetical protein
MSMLLNGHRVGRGTWQAPAVHMTQVSPPAGWWCGHTGSCCVIRRPARSCCTCVRTFSDWTELDSASLYAHSQYHVAALTGKKTSRWLG